MKLGKGYGLLAIHAIDRIDVLSSRLANWYYGAVIRPNWEALGIKEVDMDGDLSRILEAFELDPFRPWMVKELMRDTGLSSERLNRILRSSSGLTAKRFLIALRLQLVERFRQDGRMKGEQIAALLGFPNAKKLYEWRKRASNKM